MHRVDLGAVVESDVADVDSLLPRVLPPALVVLTEVGDATRHRDGRAVAIGDENLTKDRVAGGLGEFLLSGNEVVRRRIRKPSGDEALRFRCVGIGPEEVFLTKVSVQVRHGGILDIRCLEGVLHQGGAAVGLPVGDPIEEDPVDFIMDGPHLARSRRLQRIPQALFGKATKLHAQQPGQERRHAGGQQQLRRQFHGLTLVPDRMGERARCVDEFCCFVVDGVGKEFPGLRCLEEARRPVGRCCIRPRGGASKR